MSSMYLALDTMGAAIIFLLLYANIFELKQKSRKRKTFTWLLLSNLTVLLVDALTWTQIDWERRSALLFGLITITYIAPVVVQVIFAKYLFEHISEKTEPQKTPFRAISYYSVITGTVSLVLCLCGKIFEIRDGKYYPGQLEWLYYLFYITALLYFQRIILMNRKKMSFHDLTAVISFCLIPLVSILLTLSGAEIMLTVPFMAIDMLVIYILIQADGESKLFYQSNIDEMTELFNRRAYEDDMMQYPDVPPEQNFVYASIDINGLKQINDTLGHEAGDELIRGAAYCLKRTFGNRGRVYRTGGDEFASMFFADEENLRSILEDLKTLAQEWNGRLVNGVSVAVGCASKREFPTETVEEMVRVAEKRMYDEKEQFYAHKGVDRRGQHEAHKVLCSLYTKILKINITQDSFVVVNMDEEEQTKEKGYSMHISRWLEGFGKSGCVHSDDLEEYLSKTNIQYMRGYFRRKKTSLTVLYRRRYDDGFKQVMMEIIPAKDYSDENQSLYLYVKNIDI